MKSDIFRKSLDELHTDLLVTTLFEDERPPRGITGLIDWRLNGFLSRRLLDRTILGQFDERILIPIQGRLPARRWLLMGAGKMSDFTQARALSIGSKIGSALSRLAVVDVGLYVPKTKDARSLEVTTECVLDGIRQAQLSDHLSVQCLDPIILRPFEFYRAKLSAATVESNAA